MKKGLKEKFEWQQRKNNLQRMRRNRESAGTSQLSFMLSGCVSGPFVVLFSIPQQTTAGHIKHRGTKSHEKEQVCVCVCVFFSTVHVHAPTFALSHCSPRLGSLGQSLFSTHPSQFYSRCGAHLIQKVVTTQD